MTISIYERAALEELDSRLKLVLPEEYQESYEQVQPVSMGSAPLKYGADGQVAWDQMWESFCDLAMAGGPPHKGTLLEPASRAQIDGQPERYEQVVDEIRRGITLATDLSTAVGSHPGWCQVGCLSDTMAGWLVRAIMMENVSARAEGRWLDLPASPGFRLEKEIKNVITVIAKTSHYWLGHMSNAQKLAIGDFFRALAQHSPLVTPAGTEDDPGGSAAALAERIQRDTGLPSSPQRYAGWHGVECPSVRGAIWMMRALVVSNVLARREGTVLFVPLNAAIDPGGERVAAALARIHGLASLRRVLG
jgi:hypothetical protein